MEAALLRAPDEGDVVRLVAATEERADDRLPVTGDNALGQMEAEHLREQRQVGVEIVAIQQTVIEPGRLHALDRFRLYLGVDGAEPVADLLLVGEEFQRVAGGAGEAQTPA